MTSTIPLEYPEGQEEAFIGQRNEAMAGMEIERGPQESPNGNGCNGIVCIVMRWVHAEKCRASPFVVRILSCQIPVKSFNSRIQVVTFQRNSGHFWTSNVGSCGTVGAFHWTKVEVSQCMISWKACRLAGPRCLVDWGRPPWNSWRGN